MSIKYIFTILCPLIIFLSACDQKPTSVSEPSAPWKLKEPQILSTNQEAQLLNKYSQSSRHTLKTSDTLQFSDYDQNKDVQLKIKTVCTEIKGEQTIKSTQSWDIALPPQIDIYSILPHKILYRPKTQSIENVICDFEFYAFKGPSSHRFFIRTTRIISDTADAKLEFRIGLRTVDVSKEPIIEDESSHYRYFNIHQLDIKKMRFQCEKFVVDLDRFNFYVNDLRDFDLRRAINNPEYEDPALYPKQTCRLFGLKDDMIVAMSSHILMEFKINPSLHMQKEWNFPPHTNGRLHGFSRERILLRFTFLNMTIGNKNKYEVHYRINKHTEAQITGRIIAKKWENSRDTISRYINDVHTPLLPVIAETNGRVISTPQYWIISLKPEQEATFSFSIHKQYGCDRNHSLGIFLGVTNTQTWSVQQIRDPELDPNNAKNFIHKTRLLEDQHFWIPSFLYTHLKMQHDPKDLYNWPTSNVYCYLL